MPAASSPAGLSRRLVAWIAAGLLTVQVALIVHAARVTGCTTDEPNYFNCGHIVLRHGWAHECTVFQGPLPLLANQVFVDEFPRGGFPRPADAELLFRGRLGTLLFVLPAALLVFLWSRRVFGDLGGLISLAVLTFDPLWLGYGGLLLVDAQHGAAVLLLLFCLWRHLERPSAGRAAWLGASAGIALATKYLALVSASAAALVAVAATLRGAPRGSRIRRAVVASAALLAGALVMLHASYLFQGGLASIRAADYASGPVRALLDLPVLRSLAACLPRPFLQGVDYQLHQSERSWQIFLEGHVTPGSPWYFALAFLCKTPDLVLLALIPVACLWARGLRGSQEIRRLGLALAVPVGALLAFLSFGTGMQLGLRYAMPLQPALCVACGVLGPCRFLDSSRRAIAALALGCLLLALDLARNGDDWIAYYNLLSGGQARAYLHFRDSNSDFGQHSEGVVARLGAELGRPFEIVQPLSGARFGTLAVDVGSLRVSWDRERPNLDWVLQGEPCARIAASWLVFEVTPAGFEARVRAEGSPALRRDLALAYLGAGRVEEAERHLQALALPADDPLCVLLELERRPAWNPQDGQRALSCWRRLGRPDRARALLEEHPELAHASPGLRTRLAGVEETGGGARTEPPASAGVMDANELIELAGLLRGRLAPSRASELEELLERAARSRPSRFLQIAQARLHELRRYYELLE